MRPISQAAIRFFLLVGILAAAVPAAHASAARDCVDQTGTQEIAACTEFLLAKNLTKSARAMGYYYRAHGYLSTGNYEAALKDLREVIRRIGAKTEIGRAAQLLIDINNPDTADGNYAIAIGIREPQDGHDTAFFLERALSIEPDHAQSLYLRGYNRFKEGDFEGAV